MFKALFIRLRKCAYYKRGVGDCRKNQNGICTGLCSISATTAKVPKLKKSRLWYFLETAIGKLQSEPIYIYYIAGEKT